MTQLFDVIFTDLRSSKKHMNRLLTLGILFILVGHFYVVEPYFQYKLQESALSKEHRHIEDAIQRAKNTLDHTKDLIVNYPDHLLVKTLPRIEKAIFSDSSSRTFQIEVRSGIKKIDMPASILEFDEPEIKFYHAVRWYILAWFEVLMKELQKEAVTPVKQLIAKLENRKKKAEELKVNDIVDEPVGNLEAFLDGKEGREILSLYVGDDPKIRDKLKEEVDGVYKPVAEAVSRLLDITTENLVKVEDDISKLRDRITALVSQLGPVPVSLKDFIVLFPFFMVALLVMITAAFHKSGYLYIAFWHEFSKENTTKDRGAFQQFADCWYLPPYSSVVQPLLLIALPAVIAVLIIRASLLVILNADAELFTFLFPAEESSTKIIFTGAYIFGTLVIVGCFGLIFKALRRITQESIE